MNSSRSYPFAPSVLTLAIAALPLLFAGCNASKAPTAAPPSGGDGGVAGAPVHPAPQDADTPIKIRGGAPTFYSKKIWFPKLPGTGAVPTQFCTTLADASQVIIRDFDNHPGDYSLPVGATWTITLKTTNPNSGITLNATTAACGSDPGPTLQISTVGQASFYPVELKAARKNRRFMDNQCKDGNGNKLDEDACERVNELEFNGTAYTCSDLDCTILIGK